MATVSRGGIGARTLRGMAWAYGSYVGGRLLVLASTAILARLLTPEDFGVVALAITFMAILEGVADLGLGQALVIQREKVVHARANTVFVTAIGLGSALSVLLVALSPLAASFFDEPQLVGVTSALGANFLLRSIGSTHYALAQRSLDFRARTVAEFSDVVVRGTVGVVLALTGYGVWSLVLGYLTGTVARDIVIWRLVPWRPTWRMRLADLREMIGFGSTLSAVQIVATLIANIDYLFVGRVLGASSLGLYTLGFRLPELLILNLSVVAGQVLFPAFSAVDRDALGRAFLIALRYTLMLGLPMTAGLAILAEPFVEVLFGDQWLGAVGAMQILTVYALGVTVGIPAGAAYKATGRAGILLKLGLARLALVTVGLALFIEHGIEAAAASQAVVAALAAIAGIALAARLLNVGIQAIIEEAWPSLLAAASLAVALLGVRHFVQPQLLELLVAGVAGSVVYVGTLALVEPTQLRYLLARLRPPAPVPADDPELAADAEVRARDPDTVA